MKRRGDRIMKFIGLQLALQTAILAIVISAAGQADAADTAAQSRQGLQARTEYRGTHAKSMIWTCCAA
jgi:hypothetical protein